MILSAPLFCAGCVASTGAPAPESLSSPDRRAASGAAQFVDATETAGIRFTHTHGGFGDKYMPETTGAGCAFLDFDGDGHLDILLLNGRPLHGIADAGGPPPPGPSPTAALYRNTGDGRFEDVTRGSGLDVPLYAMGCAIGDYDNDGRQDVFISTVGEPNRLFRNVGGGKFTDVTEQMGVGDPKWGTSCAWLDYDRDGWLDLFVCRYVEYRWGASDAHCFNHPLGKRAYCDPRGLPGLACVLYRSEGGKRFRDVSAEAGIAAKAGKALGVSVCDYDLDGWPDLLVANDTEPNFLFHNLRNGRFAEIGLEAGVALPEVGEVRAGMGIDTADCFNDGRLCVMISNFSGEGLSLFRQDAPRAAMFTNAAARAGVFNVSLLSLGFGLFFFDYDNDGLQDAFSANGHIQPDVHEHSTNLTYGQRNLLFHNRGGGSFEEVGADSGPPFRLERVTRGAAYGDYDLDGDLDILLTNSNQPAELLRTDNESGGHWLQVELEGTRSNRSGIGARVIVKTAGKQQQRWVRSGSSYLSQSMLPVHFGLGNASRVERLEVHWPSEKVDVMKDVAADRRLRLREGEAGTSAGGTGS